MSNSTVGVPFKFGTASKWTLYKLTTEASALDGKLCINTSIKRVIFSPPFEYNITSSSFNSNFFLNSENFSVAIRPKKERPDERCSVT